MKAVQKILGIIFLVMVSTFSLVIFTAEPEEKKDSKTATDSTAEKSKDSEKKEPDKKDADKEKEKKTEEPKEKSESKDSKATEEKKADEPAKPKEADAAAEQEPKDAVVKVASDEPVVGTAESRAALVALVESLHEKLNKVQGKELDMFDAAPTNSWWQSFLEEVTEIEKNLQGLLEEAEEALTDGSELDRVEWWRDLKNVATSVEAEAKNTEAFAGALTKVNKIKALLRTKTMAAIDSIKEIKTEFLESLADLKTELKAAKGG